MASAHCNVLLICGSKTWTPFNNGCSVSWSLLYCQTYCSKICQKFTLKRAIHQKCICYYCVYTYIKTFSHMHQLLLFLANWWISSWRNYFVQKSNLVLKHLFHGDIWMTLRKKYPFHYIVGKFKQCASNKWSWSYSVHYHIAKMAFSKVSSTM